MVFGLCAKSRSFACIILALVVQVLAAAQEQQEDSLIALRRKRTAAQITPGKELTNTSSGPHDNREARHRPPRENLDVGY